MDFSKYFNFINGSVTYGLTDELIAFYVLELFKQKKKNIIFVTSNLYEGNKIFNTLKNHTENVLIFPMDDFVTSKVVAMSPEFQLGRLNALDKLKSSKQIVVTNLMGYLKYLPNKNNKDSIEIEIDKEFKRDDLIDVLNEFGYKKESLVTTTGEFSARGFILDIFPINEMHPIRIEFFGNIIESIRYFDENTQRKIEDINKITIKAFQEMDTLEKSSLYEYTNEGIVVYLNKEQIDVAYNKLCEEITEYKETNDSNEKYMYELNEINPSYELYIDTINNPTSIKASLIPSFNEDFDFLKSIVEKWQLEGKKIYFYLSKDSEEKAIKKIIPNANIIKEKLNQGFIIDDIVCISEQDIGVQVNSQPKYGNNLHIGKKIKSYNDLEKGDYIVHINHGIGIYNGLVTLTKDGLKKDYIQLLYDGNDKIYIPVEKINSIYKYSGKDSLKPKLNKLNSSSWAKTKTYIKSKAKDISKELLKLYAKRAQTKGMRYKDYVEQDLFASTFEHTETRDQAKAISEINADLNSEIPMDRLLCGDVGFGKTEVAMRAIFKTVVNNMQVMYLCPTTILAKQQYNVIKERFKDVPVEIRLLNRFTSTKEEKEILKKLILGQIDILVGTHRILSDDIKPTKLGLLVVDEEQRFGVKHKEKIKEFKNDVNVLTLSATPIPRTLKMALSGLRDLSIIDTAPVNRYPVQTYVVAENDLLIKDAIYKELSRNGQIFILYNKIEGLDKIVDRIKKLVPEAKVNYAHGQMNKVELENIMDDFVNYKYDILVCTTIIENGIDISNANTLIVFDADHFGLGQLYQIRGRVGRSDRIAYAYLLYDNRKMLNEIAIKRLQAIKEFTELGSGYKIAMRDLAIRGAGDIFGSDQAGFVDSVGISLYMKLIEDEMKRAKGEYVEEDDEDNKNLIEVSTHIKDDYVSDEDIKIEIHQKINEIDSLEKLKEVKEELEDRFGRIDNDLEIYMYEEWFTNLCKMLNIIKVIKTDRFVEITIPEEISNNIKGDKLLFETMSITNKFNIKYLHKNIIVTLFYKGLEKHYIYYLVKLLIAIKDN
ncbi:MAG: transcription-repair coupling factor [Firmicutes bacterium]|nr:transcription-repair coupling factor [Bacillota bacterium]